MELRDLAVAAEWRVVAGHCLDFGDSALGLNIVSTIVAAHGGEVAVDSTPGEGSAFHVVLPRGG